jgi:hypothetical protein
VFAREIAPVLTPLADLAVASCLANRMNVAVTVAFQAGRFARVSARGAATIHRAA